MRRVKIYGAGSIGNHLSHAARSLGWQVALCDTDPKALLRTQNDIYPSRYGKFDEAITLHEVGQEPEGDFDFIFVGTPPDSHMKIARAAIAERPKAILIEKPLCTPDLTGAQELLDEANAAGIASFVGYDHVIGAASQKVASLLAENVIGEAVTMDVEFREYWGGIFAAHPWLDGPQDTYLGYWKRGGGASGEHSHAINLWQYFAHVLGGGRVDKVQSTLTYKSTDDVDYDDLCLLHLTTERGFVGRVVQDVVTSPPRKWARIQGSEGFIELHIGYEPGVDLVRCAGKDGTVSETRFPKTRPDDFIMELRHIDGVLSGAGGEPSPLSLERGLESMMVVAASHRSALQGRTVGIGYSKGYRLEALD